MKFFLNTINCFFNVWIIRVFSISFSVVTVKGNGCPHLIANLLFNTKIFLVFLITMSALMTIIHAFSLFHYTIPQALIGSTSAIFAIEAICSIFRDEYFRISFTYADNHRIGFGGNVFFILCIIAILSWIIHLVITFIYQRKFASQKALS